LAVLPVAPRPADRSGAVPGCGRTGERPAADATRRLVPAGSAGVGTGPEGRDRGASGRAAWPRSAGAPAIGAAAGGWGDGLATVRPAQPAGGRFELGTAALP